MTLYPYVMDMMIDAANLVKSDYNYTVSMRAYSRSHMFFEVSRRTQQTCQQIPCSLDQGVVILVNHGAAKGLMKHFPVGFPKVAIVQMPGVKVHSKAIDHVCQTGLK